MSPQRLGVHARFSDTVQKSGKTAAQVVVEKELEMFSAIIGDDKTEEAVAVNHSDDCRCAQCWELFQMRLDRAVKASEDALGIRATNEPTDEWVG